MHKNLLLLLLTLFFSISCLNAQTQLTDFASKTEDKSSSPGGFISYKNLIFFEATTEDAGREIWMNDESSAKPKLLKDIFPGEGSSIQYSFKQSAVVFKDKLFFIANNGENGNQIWSSDGTEQGTNQISNLSNLNFLKLTVAGNYIFFLVQEGELLQVWRSDGTASGTIMLQKDLPIWNTPTFEGEANNLFFFTFQPKGSNNSRVWRSNGSTTGTFPITEELDGNGANPNGSAAPTQYIEFKNELYFVVRSPVLFSYPTSVGIIKTDGSIENTVPIKAVHDATDLLNFADVLKVNDKLYFSFYDVDYFRLFIWESDGTEAGTKKIFDQSGDKYYGISNLSTDGKNLTFMGKSRGGETALLKLKLDTYQVEEIKEIATNLERPFIYTDYSLFQIKQVTANRFVFFTPSFPVQTWATDLTPANTLPLTNLKDVRREIVNFNQKIYFPAFSEDEGFELWQSELDFSNAHLLANINASKYGLDNAFTVLLNDKLFFTADDGVHGLELWVYNKVTAEKHLVKDIWAGSQSAEPRQLIVFNNLLYFVANTEEHGSQLWRSDGTAESTSKISSLNEISKFSYINQLLATPDKIYFSARVNDYYVLYGSDGTQTELIKTFKEVNYTSMKEIVAAGKLVYFTIEGGGEDLWRSDGTPNGTYKLKDLISINYLTAVEDKVYFVGKAENQKETELWYSDGTQTGTKQVKNIGKGYSSNPANLVSFQGQVVFTAYTTEYGREYWKSDGSAEGTILIADINPGTASSVLSSTDYTLFQGALYFSANDGSHGTELWKTDGTGTGTILIQDINEGATGSFPKNLVNNAERLYFRAYSPANGTEIWQTEGTSSSTRQVFDLNSGSAGSTPSNLTFSEQDLFFLAESNHSGRQLWLYNKGIITGLEDPIKSSALKLYPNPTSDYLYIEKGNSRFDTIKIINTKGQQLLTFKDSSGKLNVKSLEPGIYLLVGESKKEVIVRKFIKQ
ncbi:ELWxxDGT repeat protein [Adhaeribacter radiodurans]|uniref:T9SS type A sorting domain-containing protein n=1 Tax=Adhaeribacter radiodurans TaxID=2745197 RepID=A0A7L7LB57_9BACT|nr:ELWxxDGT repeat protein [Adhaeribacter radiodurans]QMU29954.1 T9SS type A sorting domain-containing protein [Adhaeribacter radiodurans]